MRALREEVLMVSSKYGKRYSAEFKFQVILEVLKGSKTIGQIARSYGVHPITLSHWMKEFMEKGPELFSQQTTIHE
jgi:transposase-like protein